MATVDESLKASEAAALEGLKAFVRHQSISSQPEHRDDVRACAEWLAGELRATGLEHVELWDTAGHPVVYADWLHAPGAPTVLLYGHYDVQPPEPLELWESPPFEAAVRDGRIFARGAADDKGQVWMHVAALRAIFAVEGRLPVNIKLLIEGEEEIGSANLEPAVAAHRAELAADLVLISDTTMYPDGLPALTYGLRGLAYFQVEVEGANSDLHSGMYGGAVANPLQALATLIAGLKDERGRITLPGFYDDVRSVDQAERDLLAAVPQDDAAYRAALGVDTLPGEEGYSTLERTWIRPSLDINGIWGGYAGPGAKTVLPAKGGAKLSFRLVPDQRPERVAALLEEDLRRRCPPGVRLSVNQITGSARPWLAPTDHPAMQAARRALARAFGREPIYTRSGGSIPVVMIFDQHLGVPVVMLGVADQDCHAHAPNERFSLANFHGGARAAAYFLREMR